MRHEGEPSVEEILDSIKKVIARDNRESHQAERRRRESAGIAFEPGDTPDDDDEAGEVLDLGEDLIQAESPPRSEEGLTTESAARSMRVSRTHGLP